MFQANIEGILAVAAILMAWGFGIVLYRVGARGSVARKLAVLLALEGYVLATGDSLLLLLGDPQVLFQQFPWLEKGMVALHTLGDCAMLALYPPFLAASLRTRLTSPFASRRGQQLLLGLAAVLYLGCQASFLIFDAGPASFSVLFFFMATLFLYAFIASLHAWVVATGSTRSRARIFTLAFGFRDVSWNVVYGFTMYLTWFTPDSVSVGSSSLLFILYPLGTLVAIPLIAYGILRTQLFDLDLKLRWTIKQSTFAAIVVAISFVISEGVEMLVADEWGDIWGLLAAAVAVVFLKPLQACAEKVVSRLMPNTRDTPEYKNSRKADVYQEAVSEAVYEGGISERERNLLVRLRVSLGVSEAEALAIENRVLRNTALAG